MAMESIEVLRQSIYDALARHDSPAAREIIERLRPGHEIEAQGLLASSFIEEGDGDRALAAARDLEKLTPEDPYAHYLIARAMFLRGGRRAVIEVLEPLLANKKKRIAPIYQEKILNLLGQCYRFFGDGARSAECYRRAALAADSLELKALEYSDFLFNCHFLPAGKASGRRRRAAGYGAIFQGCEFFLPRWRQTEKKIRIGYISPDLRNHVVLRFCHALLTAYDRGRFEVFAYANCPEDSYSRTLAAAVSAWRNIYGLTPSQAARLIYEDGVDILVDLAGHTRGNSLPALAYKPAPIAVSGIGYFASTGLAAVDYFFGDAFLDDAATAAEFTEKLIVLPRSHFCYTPLGKAPTPNEAPCQTKGYVTFGSFNSFAKVNDDVLSAWKEILDQVPKARLLLKAGIFDFGDGQEAVRARLERVGIAPERVETRGESRDYLREYADIDIALDTFPYPGGGTTCDALYMGVPVITLADESHGGRFGKSLLENIGLPELVTASREEYIARAVALAGDSSLLAALHRSLRLMMEASPLMDRAGYMRDVEAAYRSVWQSYCAAQAAPDYRRTRELVAKLDSFQAAGDRTQALAAADYILAAKPANRPLLERLAVLYLDAADAKASEAVRALRLEDRPYGYGWFLAASVALLRNEAEKAKVLVGKALADGTLLPWQRGAVHHLLAEIHKRQGNRQKAATEYLLSSQDKDVSSGKLADYSNYLLNLHFDEQPPAALLAAAKGYGALLTDISPYRHALDHHCHDRLRVGYISPDFRRHIVACFSQAFFAAANRERFAVYGYANCPEDDMSRHFRAAADIWRNVFGQTAEETASLIYQDEIDILVDLSGHTGDNTLPVLAYKPAPVIVSGIGYFDTTGLPAVDYFLADAFTAPDGAQAYFTERLIRLPHSHLCYAPPPSAPKETLPSPVLRDRPVVFGSLNQLDKLTDPILGAWAKILRMRPTARLFLKAGAFDDAARARAFRQKLESAGIPLDRVETEGHTEDYFRAYEAIDIALDSYPYPGGGTTCDALYMVVPVISLYGTGHHERFGLSLLSNLGLEGLAVPSLEEYVSRVVGLADDRELLAILRRNLRPMMRRSPLMDAAGYMRDVEAAYERIWRAWREN